MEQFKFFVGIDISKATLDFSAVHCGKQIFYKKSKNNPKEIQRTLKQMVKECSLDLAQSVFCMEHTGIYNNHLLSALYEQSLTIWLESAVQIKRSLGLQRGKNDKVDAHRIALYAYRNRDDIKTWQPAREQLQKLKQLFRARKRLINIKSGIKKSLNEFSFLSQGEQEILKTSYSNTLKALEKDLTKVDHQIEQLIKKDNQLQHLFALVTSVKGIGKVSAIHIIITTNEFKNITEAKKFACYAGVAPFEHSSGTSVLGRSRVSSMADKSVKSSLHMTALTAVQESGELQDYFLRKIEQGKNKMTVINAVRNKLIQRVFACVRDNRMYIPN